jgi:hypothetical protein
MFGKRPNNFVPAHECVCECGGCGPLSSLHSQSIQFLAVCSLTALKDFFSKSGAVLFTTVNIQLWANRRREFLLEEPVNLVPNLQQLLPIFVV